MGESVKIVSMNVRGLGNKVKRTYVFNYIRKMKVNIACLQDIRIDPRLESYIRAEWGGEIIFCPYKSNARGILILFNNTFEYKLNKYWKDISCNLLLVDVTICGKECTLISLYGPNRDCPEFYRSLNDRVQQVTSELIILCGDWNVALEPRIDTFNYSHVNNPQAREQIKQLMRDSNLVDIWRNVNENKRRYTWQQNTPEKKARLDFFLVTENVVNYTQSIKILPGYRTDHSMITLDLHLCNVKSGRGYWKFNGSLLKDKKVCRDNKKHN